MNKIFSKTLLSYRDAVFFENIGANPSPNLDVILGLAVDMSKLGYALSVDTIDYLKGMTDAELIAFRNQTVKMLKEVLGDDVKHAPLFRKFPDSIPSRDVLIVQVIDYFGDYYGHIYAYYILGKWSSSDYNGTWFGRQFPGVKLGEAINRPALVTDKALKVLVPATYGDVFEIFKNLLAAKGSNSVSDKSFISEVIAETDGNWLKHVPSEIPNKENLAFTIGEANAVYGFNAEVFDAFSDSVKTSTDVLRIAAAFSGSDVSLAEHTRFKLSNSQRRFVLQSLDALNYQSATEDMLRFHGLWLVLAKYLHANAYADKYPNAAKMVQAIRNAPQKIETFNRKIEEQLLAAKWQAPNKRDSKNTLELLKSRPGDFARRLDHVLRITPDTNAVADAFLEVVDRVASPLLLNLATHVYYRQEPANVRVYCPKGSTTQATVVRGDDRRTLDESVINKLVAGINKSLEKRYAEKPSLGKVYIDPALQDILVPTSMRDSSDSLKTFARGSKFPIGDDTKIVRLFLYWENQKDDADTYGYCSRVDVDLSAQMLDENFKQSGVVSYYNLSSMGVTHSGDFTDATNGASEFIDIDIDKLYKATRSRYIAMTVNVYTGQNFNTFRAMAGYMVRDGKTGKSYEPKSVEQKYDITAGTKFAVPMILDLKERKVIWMDLGLHDAAKMFTNVGHKGADLSTLSQYAVEMYREKANMLDLLLLHTKGRAESVSVGKFDPDEKYDTVCDLSMAARVDEIKAEWI